MKASEMLNSVLCDQEGHCCIQGSSEDRQIIDKVIEKVKWLEEGGNIEQLLLLACSLIAKTGLEWNEETEAKIKEQLLNKTKEIS